MPSRNSTKEYIEDSYYHIYNRGIEKRPIFKDKHDYAVFLALLQTAVTPRDVRKQVFGVKAREAVNRRFDISDDVSINAFCLVSNHFHLLVHTSSGTGISRFMQSISNAYVRFFNTKHDRIGPLFQGRYKAVRINNDAQAAHITRYIHLNAIDAGKTIDNHPFSSYVTYIGKKDIEWVDYLPILNLLGMTAKQYEKFVHDYISRKKDLSILKKEIKQELEI